MPAVRKGRGKGNRKSRNKRGWEAIAAVVKLQTVGKRPTSASIARLLGIKPSSHLRQLLSAVCDNVPGFGYHMQNMPNGHWRRVYSMDTDTLYRTSRDLWDTLAGYVSLQYPVPGRAGDDDIPF